MGSSQSGVGWRRRALAVWCSVALVVGLVSAVVHDDASTTAVTASGPARPRSTTTTTVPPTTTTVAASDATVAAGNGGGTAPAPAQDGGLDDGSINSVMELGPGPVETRDPVACVPASTGATGSIVVLDPAHGCVRVLASSDEPAGPELSWAPDGSWLLATLNLHVVRIAADGSWRQDLGGGGQAEAVTMSPDGTRMAIQGNVPCCHLDQRRVIVVANSDGTGAVIAHYDVGRFFQPPVWSRDSQLFAYVNQPYVGTYTDPQYLHVRTRDGDEVAVRSFEGRGGMNLNTNTPSPALIGRPEWLADGTLVTPVVMESPAWQPIYWYNADLSDASGPTNPEAMAFERVASSPDASRVIYHAYDRDNGNFVTQLWLLDRSTGAANKIVHGGVMPSWSPAGPRFAYAQVDPNADIPTPKTIMIGALDGSASAVWTPSSTNCSCWLFGPPLWSPDGAQLAIATH